MTGSSVQMSFTSRAVQVRLALVCKQGSVQFEAGTILAPHLFVLFPRLHAVRCEYNRHKEWVMEGRKRRAWIANPQCYGGISVRARRCEPLASGRPWQDSVVALHSGGERHGAIAITETQGMLATAIGYCTILCHGHGRHENNDPLTFITKEDPFVCVHGVLVFNI